MKKSGRMVVSIVQYLCIFIGSFLMLASMFDLLVLASKVTQLIIGSIILLVGLSLAIKEIYAIDEVKNEEVVDAKQEELPIESKENANTLNMHVVLEDEEFGNAQQYEQEHTEEMNEIQKQQENINDHFETATLTVIDEKSYLDADKNQQSIDFSEDLSNVVKSMAELAQPVSIDVETATDLRVDDRKLTLNIEEELDCAEKQQEESINSICDEVKYFSEVDQENETSFKPAVDLTETQIMYINNSESSYFNEQGLPQLVISNEVYSNPILESENINKNVETELENTKQILLNLESEIIPEVEEDDLVSDNQANEQIEETEPEFEAEFDTNKLKQVEEECEYQEEVIDETIITNLADISNEKTFELETVSAEENLQQDEQEIREETDTTPIIKISNTTEQSIKDLVEAQKKDEVLSDEEYYDHYEKEDRIIGFLSKILLILILACIFVGAWYVYTRYLS